MKEVTELEVFNNNNKIINETSSTTATIIINYVLFKEIFGNNICYPVI